MVINKRAQGLPMNLIVIAAIAALVLVLVIAFTIGGFGAFFSKIFGGGQAAVGEEIDVVRTTCAGLCDTAKGSTSITGWTASSYCNRNFDIDLDGDGGLGCSPEDEEAGLCEGELNKAGQDEVNINCWDPGIDVTCSTTIAGQSCTATVDDDCICQAPTAPPTNSTP